MNLLPNQHSYLWLFHLKLLPQLTRRGWARGSRCVVLVHVSHNSSEMEEHWYPLALWVHSAFLMWVDAAPAAHTAEGERSQALKAAFDLRHRHQMPRAQKGELARYNEYWGESRFDRWCKEQETVQGVEISGYTGISQILFYISCLEQANLKRISTALGKQSWTKPKTWKIMMERKAVGN